MSLFSNLAGRFGPAHKAIRQGDGLLNDGDLDGAIDAYSRAIEHDPTSDRAFYSRAIVYRQLEDFKDALFDFDEAIRINEAFAQAYYHRGLTRIAVADYDGASEDMTRALDSGLDEKYLALGTRATALFAAGAFDEAHADYLRAETVLVGWVYARAGLAICHHALGEIEPARELWRGLIERDERYGDIEWVQAQFSWPEPLLAQAEALISQME